MVKITMVTLHCLLGKFRATLMTKVQILSLRLLGKAIFALFPGPSLRWRQTARRLPSLPLSSRLGTLAFSLPATPAHRRPTVSDMAVDTGSQITTKDLKEKKEVVEEAENGREDPANGTANEENGEQEADNEVEEEEGGEEEEEEEEGDGEEEDGDEDEEVEAAMGKWAAEDDEDDDVDTKKQKTDEDD
uniref:prothymosin alpha-like n=1 Tax=Jaculus jaculus TaxID=51337 RepID=UPI001E1B5AF1|nr:prothymosin alpha-like [Jaculus jaculus]